MMNMNLKKVLEMVNLNPKQKRVWMNVGVPASGKTTFIKKVQKNLGGTIISRDEIRFSMVGERDKYFSKEKIVFDTYVEDIQKCIDRNENNVYLDATHINKNSRNKILNKLNLKDYEVIALYYDSMLSACLKRNSGRNGMSYVPEYVITKMFAEMTYPNIEEENKIDRIIKLEID